MKHCIGRAAGGRRGPSHLICSYVDLPSSKLVSSDSAKSEHVSLFGICGLLHLTTPNGGHFRNTLPKFSDCPGPSIYEASSSNQTPTDISFLLHPDEVKIIADRIGLNLDKFLLFSSSLTNGHVKTESLLKVLPRNVVDALEQLTCALPKTIKGKLLVHMAARFAKVRD